jgi:hypothetical protein
MAGEPRAHASGSRERGSVSRYRERELAIVLESRSHWDPRITGLIVALVATIVILVWGPRRLARSTVLHESGQNCTDAQSQREHGHKRQSLTLTHERGMTVRLGLL